MKDCATKISPLDRIAHYHVALNVPFCRIKPDAFVPKYQTSGSSGADLHACLGSDPIVIPQGGRSLIPTGLAMQVPFGWEGQIRPRSGLAYHNGVTVLNAPGTIDSDYRGEIMVLLVNFGNFTYEVYHGDRIAQLVFAQVFQASLERADHLVDTPRSSGGFGHTGRGVLQSVSSGS